MRCRSPLRKIDVVIAAVGKALDMGNVLSVLQKPYMRRASIDRDRRFHRSDVEALRSDWVAVGMDLTQAIHMCSPTHDHE
ncbi:MAG: hypothetical protein ACP5M0_16135 [Desulfomonilaceae bacterium]